MLEAGKRLTPQEIGVYFHAENVLAQTLLKRDVKSLHLTHSTALVPPKDRCLTFLYVIRLFLGKS
jgi:hypothetical protein